jgi:hypothetical protein
MNNRFELEFIEATLSHNSESARRGAKLYHLILSNRGDTYCDAIVNIEGKSVGTWEIKPHSKIVIDGPKHSTQKFEYWKKNWDMVIGKIDKSQDGLIHVSFVPDKRMYERQYIRSLMDTNGHGSSVYINTRGEYVYELCNCSESYKIKDMLGKLHLPEINNTDTENTVVITHKI